MIDRIDNTFRKLRENNRAALITFLTAGDPSISTTLKIIKKLPKAGADLIELGMPFSDPMADGPTIQKSYNRALENGTKIIKIFNMVKFFRKDDSYTPIIIMGYYNPIFKYGVDKFIENARKNGIDGVLIVDLPSESDKKIEKKFYNSKLKFIKLTTPTTNSLRLKKIISKTTGFLYYVSITGITGAKINSFKHIEESYKRLKKIAKLPFVVGFGIDTPEKANKVARYADGVVVGSAIIKQIENNKNNDNQIIKNVLKLTKQYSKKIKTAKLGEK